MTLSILKNQIGIGLTALCGKLQFVDNSVIKLNILNILYSTQYKKLTFE